MSRIIVTSVTFQTTLVLTFRHTSFFCCFVRIFFFLRASKKLGKLHVYYLNLLLHGPIVFKIKYVAIFE